VTIPVSGSASVTVYDQSCNALSGPFAVYNGSSSLGPPMNSGTSPAVTFSGGELQFSANGAPIGSTGTAHIVFSPNGQPVNITYTVGAPVTSISAGTLTP
jgi:hypothetical protein